MAPQIFIRPECGRKDLIGEEVGPFEYIQLTYSELDGLDGEPIAGQTCGDEWVLDPKYGDPAVEWSDIVIYTKDDGLQAKFDALLAACERFGKAHFVAGPYVSVDPPLYVEFEWAIDAAKQ